MRYTSLELKQTGPFAEATLHFPEKVASEGAEIHILTGQNGCGKSTVLYALGALDNSDPLVLERQWSLDAYTRTHWGSLPSESHLVTRIKGNTTFGSSWSDARRTGIWPPKRTDPAEVFSYSGNRSHAYPKRAEISGKVLEPRIPSFEAPAKPEELVLWIADKIGSRALETRPEVAARHAATLLTLETALSDMVGKEVKLLLKPSPLRVLLMVDGREQVLNTLPDGLKSILGWVGDLLMRLDAINDDPGLDPLAQPFILLLDEVDIHLHPSWQRRVLPTVQKMFPNAQVFCSTHSPIVVNSVDDAWVHVLQLKDGLSTPLPATLTDEAVSYATVLATLFETSERFGPDVEASLSEFYELRRRILHEKGQDFQAFKDEALKCAELGREVAAIVLPELRQMEALFKKQAAS